MLSQGIRREKQTHGLAALRRCVLAAEHQQAHLAALSRYGRATVYTNRKQVLLQARGCGKVTFQRRTNLKIDRYDGNSKRFEHGDRRDAAGRLGIERCGETNSGSGTDAQATLCWRTFPHGQGSVRAAVYQSPYLAGLPRQKNHPLHTICREDTLQGFGLGKDAGEEL